MAFWNNKEEQFDIDDEEIKTDERIKGKIIHLAKNAGWGFISSHDIKFTRIFFHWTALEQDTKHFTELEKGMEVEFNPKDYGDKGWRAIHIKVINNDSK